MQYFLLFLLFCFFLSLFCLYIIGKEDITFIKKSVSLEDLFTIAILTTIVGGFSARLLFVLDHFKSIYLNPFVFLLIPYYPGLSLLGGLIGGLVFLYFYSKRKKLPLTRISDFFALSFLLSLPVGYIGTIFLYKKFNPFLHIYMPILLFILFILFIRVLYQRLLSNKLESGIISGIFVMTVSFIVFVLHVSTINGDILNNFHIEDALSVMVFIAALIYLFKQEKFDLDFK